jgi:hypothetical protein
MEADMDKMTVKEVAEILGKDESTIRKIGKELFPTIFANGVKTLFNEAQTTAIKLNLGKNSELPKTSLEKQLIIRQAMLIQNEMIQELQEQLGQAVEQLAISAPKVESFDAMQRADNTMSITQAAKHFGLHPKTEVFPYLRDSGYLTGSDLPSQSALDAGYLVQRQVRCPDGVFRPAACVMLSQLETWRVRVVPQIAAWKERNK